MMLERNKGMRNNVCLVFYIKKTYVLYPLFVLTLTFYEKLIIFQIVFSRKLLWEEEAPKKEDHWAEST